MLGKIYRENCTDILLIIDQNCAFWILTFSPTSSPLFQSTEVRVECREHSCGPATKGKEKVDFLIFNTDHHQCLHHQQRSRWER